MQDPTLRALLSACVENPSDEASLAALADRMLECSAADRVEALRGMTDAANRLETVRTHGGYAICGHKPRRLSYSRRISRLDAHNVSYDLPGVEAARLRERAGVELLRAVEPRHWYAIRLDEYRGGSVEDRLTHSFSLDVTLSVSPLDGGRINEG